MANLKTTDTALVNQQALLKEYYEASYPKSIREVILAESKSIVAIRKELSETVCVAFLVVIIGDCIKFFSVGKSMNDAQLVETAKLIMNEFYFLKVSDLQLFFQRFKTGYYGQLFDRLDGSVIMVALREYCEEKQSAVVLVAAEIKQQEIINKEDYVLMLGESYIHETEDTYDTVKEKELATKYTYREAMDIKMNVSKELKVVDSKKCEGGFFLANAKEEKKIKPSVNNIYKFNKQQILDDETLTPLQKENKIRLMTGLVGLTQEEFEQRQEMIKK